MRYFPAWLPVIETNAVPIYMAVFLASSIVIGIICLVFSKKIQIPGTIKTGLSFIAIGLYPVIDGLMVGYGGDIYAVAFRWVFLVIGFMFIAGHFLASFIRSKKCNGKGPMVLTSDWASLDDK